LRSPDFGIVAGLAILVLLCASLPYMSIAEGIILTAMLQIPCIVVKLWRVCREEKDQKNVNIVVSSKSD